MWMVYNLILIMDMRSMHLDHLAGGNDRSHCFKVFVCSVVVWKLVALFYGHHLGQL